MDDITIFATVLSLVVTSVGFLAHYFNEQLEQVDATHIDIIIADDDGDEKPLPRKQDVIQAAGGKNSHKVDDNKADDDAQTADTVDSDDVGWHTHIAAKAKKEKPRRSAKRWSRVYEAKRDPAKKTHLFWRPQKKSKRAAAAAAPSENMGYEV